MSSPNSTPATTTSPAPAPAPAQFPTPAPQSDPPPNPSQVNGPAENGVSDFGDKKPDLAQTDQSESLIMCGLPLVRILTLYGGDIFERVTIDGEVIQSSRWPCMRSYADPVNSFHEMLVNSLNSIPETNPNIANGKHSSKKSG
ncbi:hypothetical protein MLD38_032808 [Melastoma candidum]|uniref:Uncharacterized protein n=1 Tax=Melastoma candidum TaxID=119954 RepID=A0ACB9M5B3_9MYRT|nr:hypothetical protein MLD38_032808 [Melastoma candidum]